MHAKTVDNIILILNLSKITHFIENLLGVDISTSVYKRNIMVGCYRTRCNRHPSFMEQIFEEREMPYNVRFSDSVKISCGEKTFLESKIYGENMDV